MIDTDYGPEFFAMHVAWHDDYRRIAEILHHKFDCKSVLDLGCGNGYIITRLEELGHEAIGIDGSIYAKDYRPVTLTRNLTQPIDVGPFDLVICTEVAEHLAAEYADVLVGSICKAATKTVFFSAARHGRGGHLHVNEQPATYWMEKFKVRGFMFDWASTADVRWQISNAVGPIWWFAINSLVFHRDNR